MQHQKSFHHEYEEQAERPSSLCIISIAILIILSCLVLLSSCVSVPKTLYFNSIDYGNGRHYEESKLLVVHELPS